MYIEYTVYSIQYTVSWVASEHFPLPSLNHRITVSRANDTVLTYVPSRASDEQTSGEHGRTVGVFLIRALPYTLVPQPPHASKIGFQRRLDLGRRAYSTVVFLGRRPRCALGYRVPL